MESPTTYTTAWRNYRHRRNGFIAAVISLTVLLALVSAFPGANLLAAYWWVLAPFLFAWFIVAGFRLTYWRCPRCNKPFFTRLLLGNLFARRCLHCHLPKWSDPEAGARGA